MSKLLYLVLLFTVKTAFSHDDLFTELAEHTKYKLYTDFY